MKNLAMLALVLLVCSNCGNISSSELIQTEAVDLKLTATIYELNGDDTASVNALALTIPDYVGIQFDQGETFQVSIQTADDSFSALSLMAYTNNFLDLGEQYNASLTKPTVGNLYRITYTDKDDLVTEADFFSEGVPELITPTANEVVPLDSTLTLTWEPQELGALVVKVTYSTLTGGTGSASFTTTDTGTYDLDLTQTAFDDAAPGEAIVELSHTATYTDFTGWGEALVSVKSRDRQTIQLE